MNYSPYPPPVSLCHSPGPAPQYFVGLYCLSEGVACALHLGLQGAPRFMLDCVKTWIFCLFELKVKVK